MSFRQVRTYETGRNRVGAARLRAVADRLGVPVSTFFDDAGDGENDRGAVGNVLQDAEVLELVRTFTAISDETVRRSVLSIVKAAATLQAAVAPTPN